MTNKIPMSNDQCRMEFRSCFPQFVIRHLSFLNHSDFGISHLPAAVFIFIFLTIHAAAAADTAFMPSNPPEMQRLTNHDSSAYQAAKLFMHGANLGNYLEAPPGQNWGVTFTANEAAIMRAEGFDHLRVP